MTNQADGRVNEAVELYEPVVGNTEKGTQGRSSLPTSIAARARHGISGSWAGK